MMILNWRSRISWSAITGHTHGFLLSAELAEEFTRMIVSFPAMPPVGVQQMCRLRDSAGELRRCAL